MKVYYSTNSDILYTTHTEFLAVPAKTVHVSLLCSREGAKRLMVREKIQNLSYNFGATSENMLLMKSQQERYKVRETERGGAGQASVLGN